MHQDQLAVTNLRVSKIKATHVQMGINRQSLKKMHLQSG
jgi:hypothetical protein